jgi:predicted Holliday junction resolvase-like endonuclease
MKSDTVNFFWLQRQIFGVCPKCQDFFRLSDCKIFIEKKPLADWMDKITLEKGRLDELEEKLEEKKEDLQEKAREAGRKLAQRAVKKIDPVFAPHKLNPDDAKVISPPLITWYSME